MLLCLQPIDMTPQQSQIHDDLQRKHAQLQAAIGQQQAELRMVSEQLIMSRLGLLRATQTATGDVSTRYVFVGKSSS